MATTPPYTPDQFKAIIPAANASWCEKLLGVPTKLAIYLYNMAAWAIKSDGTPTDDFKAWVGLSVGTLSVPGSVSASDGSFSNKVTVSWSGVTGAAGYRIYRGTTTDSSAATLIGTSSTTSYDDTTVTAGSVYNYWVKAYDASGESAFSSYDSGYSDTSGSGNTQSLTFTGSFTVPTGVTSITAAIWGNGGNGGASGSPPFSIPSQGPFAGGGGGGGEYAHGTIPVTAGEVLSVTVDTGGSAIIRSSTVLLSALGGSNGSGGVVVGAPGGAGGTGGTAAGSTTGVTRASGTAGSAGSTVLVSGLHEGTGGTGGGTTPVETNIGTGGNGASTGTTTVAATNGKTGKVTITW
jgi:hypothetical protein